MWQMWLRNCKSTFERMAQGNQGSTTINLSWNRNRIQKIRNWSKITAENPSRSRQATRWKKVRFYIDAIRYRQRVKATPITDPRPKIKIRR